MRARGCARSRGFGRLIIHRRDAEFAMGYEGKSFGGLSGSLRGLRG